MVSPFSLTPDPRFYFRSRSHGRVFDTLSAAINRRENLMLVTGDLGVGKTTLCKTLLDSQERKSRAALAGNALMSPEDLLRLMLQDLGAVTRDEAKQGRLIGVPRAELVAMFDRFLGQLRSTNGAAVMIVDEAHSLPRATKDQIIELASLESNRDRLLQFLLAGQPAIGGGALFPELDGGRRGVRARLLPLERDECDRYIAHRMAIAGRHDATFAAATVDTIYALSGGVPRLVNLLCERALREASDTQSPIVEAPMIQSAASALDLLRLKPRRFRWYGGSRR